MNVVQCLSHSIEEYDMLRMYARLGVNCFSIGGYITPGAPHDDKRPGVQDMPFFPQLKEAVDNLRQPDNLRAAQENIPPELLDWADVIVFHHYLERLAMQWPRLKDWKKGHPERRVIWRSVGQSVAENEAAMQQFVREGVERVAYSPKEANIPNYTGHAALIRFGKDPADWYGWTGEEAVVGNLSQHDETPHARDQWLNWGFWEEATEGLPVSFAGVHSEKIGGLGKLSYDDMRAYLRRIRVMLYTGTQPASYTLGLIEAMMTGVPVVSIGPERMTIFPYGPALFEGYEIAGGGPAWDHPIHDWLEVLLEWPNVDSSKWARQRAIDLFGLDTIAAQWAAFLDVPVPSMVAA